MGQPGKAGPHVFRALDPDAHIDALAGEVDAIDVGPTPTVSPGDRHRQRRILFMGEFPSPDHQWHQNLQDVKVRQAVAMAIDRTAIARALLVR